LLVPHVPTAPQLGPVQSIHGPLVVVLVLVVVVVLVVVLVVPVGQAAVQAERVYGPDTMLAW
jgi:hypothetical protein